MIRTKLTSLLGVLLAAFAALLGALRECQAGGGPENVLLVVNERSYSSLTIANHYIKLRGIPSVNVVYLNWDGDLIHTDMATFRQRILGPVMQAMQQRKIAGHIDYIVYSSDFPTTIDARSVVRNELPQQHSPVGSITGLTYLHSDVMAGRADFIALDANYYLAQRTDAADAKLPSREFRSWYGWGKGGQRLEAGGRTYYLSTMLAVTAGRGNSIDEALAYLTRSAEADCTSPAGTIYFPLHDDVRSKTRMPSVPMARRALDALGVRSAAPNGVLPTNRNDVAGLMIGSANFDWAASRSQILPGAICENLTSFGGRLDLGASQSPLTELLRYGAAGSSGTVVEPYAIQSKFPLPFVQVHYARGCSLAEAFYQSVAGPYQLLIVGDPLCQPWAKRPEVLLEGLAADETVSGNIQLTARSDKDSATIDRCEWFIDGQRIAITRLGDRVTLNTLRLPDGWHELRVVAIRADEIATQGQSKIGFFIANQAAKIHFTVNRQDVAYWGHPLQLQVEAPGAKACGIFQGTRLIGRIDGDAGTITIDPQTLGSGPIALHAAAINGAQQQIGGVVSPRQYLDVQPSEHMEPIPLGAGNVLMPGFHVMRLGERPRVVESSRDPQWLQKAGIGSQEEFAVTGVFRVPHKGIYQYCLQHTGPLKICVNEQPIYREPHSDGAPYFVPVALEAGVHHLKIIGTTTDQPQVSISFGGAGLRPLDGDLLRHLEQTGDTD